MKRIPVTMLILCALAVPAAYAHHDTQVAQTGAGATATAMTDGEVRKVDNDTGTITLKHGEIKNLRMSPMTMVFQVKDKAMLDKVKTGDKITVDAENRVIDADITDEEFARRRAAWKAPAYKATRGTLYKYIKTVKPASEGCVTDE